MVDEAEELLFTFEGAEGGGEGRASCGAAGQLLLLFSSMATDANCGSASRVGRRASDLSTAFPSEANSSSLWDGASTETRAGRGLEEAEEEEDLALTVGGGEPECELLLPDDRGALACVSSLTKAECKV